MPYKTFNMAGEPALADVFADPIVRLVMARDGLDPEEVRRFVRRPSGPLPAPRRGKDRQAA